MIKIADIMVKETKLMCARWAEHYGTALNHPTACPQGGNIRIAAVIYSENDVHK